MVLNLCNIGTDLMFDPKNLLTYEPKVFNVDYAIKHGLLCNISFSNFSNFFYDFVLFEGRNGFSGSGVPFLQLVVLFLLYEPVLFESCNGSSGSDGPFLQLVVYF